MNGEECQFCFWNKQCHHLKKEKCGIMNMPSVSSLLCNRRCAKPLAGLVFLSLFYTPLKSAVNYAKFGQWEKYCPEMLNPNIKCQRAQCKNAGWCVLRYQEGEKPITLKQRANLCLTAAAMTWKSTFFFFYHEYSQKKIEREREERCVCWGFGRFMFPVLFHSCFLCYFGPSVLHFPISGRKQHHFLMF